MLNEYSYSDAGHRATVAGDGEVRVFDVGATPLSHSSSGPTTYTVTRDIVRVIKCHAAAVKQIVTEESSDVFLTVSEVRD